MDLTDLKGIISLMQRTDLTELEIEVQDLKLRLARPNANSQASLTQIPVAHLPPTPAATEKLNPNENLQAKDNHNLFKSPMVGTFYLASSPDSPPFAKVGDRIGPEKTVCIVEAMKVFNEIPAGVSGQVVAILVENGAPIEFGQPLIKVDPGT